MCTCYVTASLSVCLSVCLSLLVFFYTGCVPEINRSFVRFLFKDVFSDKKFPEHAISFYGDISQIVENAPFRNVEESLEKFLGPVPEADDFPVHRYISLKFSRRSDQ